MKSIYLLMPLSGILLFLSCSGPEKSEQWKTIQPGTMGISLETPFDFKEVNISSSLTPAVKKVIKKMETFSNEEQGRYFAISMVEYTDDVTFSAEGALNGSVSEMRMRTGGEITDQRDETQQINGARFHIRHATINDRNKNKMDLQMAITNKDQKMYQVISLYQKSNKKLAENTKRIIESIKID